MPLKAALRLRAYTNCYNKKKKIIHLNDSLPEKTALSVRAYFYNSNNNNNNNSGALFRASCS